MKPRDLTEMKLHDEIYLGSDLEENFSDEPSYIVILRVMSGWIYSISTGEFNKETNEPIRSHIFVPEPKE